MNPKPPSRVWHGTDADFDTFDISTSLGAHFGSRQAAADRLRDTGRHRIDWTVYESDEGWMAMEQTYRAKNGKSHGPFDTNDAAHAFCAENPYRSPVEFEIDVYRPLEMPDLGTWTFEGVHAWLARNHDGFPADEVWDAWNRSTESGWTALKNALKAARFDCIVYRNETEDAGSLSWIVFDPERIHRVADWRDAEQQPATSAQRPSTRA